MHNLPFKRIIKQIEVEVTDSGFRSEVKNLAFIFNDLIDWSDDKIVTTAEGVYIRFSDFQDDSFYKNTGIKESTAEVDLQKITELTMASMDFDLTLTTELAMKEYLQACNNFKTILEIFRITSNNQCLRTKDFKNEELIIYSNNKFIYRASCDKIRKIIIGKTQNVP